MIATLAINMVGSGGAFSAVFPLQAKAAVAATLVDRIEEFLAAQPVKDDTLRG